MTERRVPNGWIVLGGSVLASFVWWMVSRPANRVAPPAAPAVTSAPVEAVPEVAPPVKPTTAPPRARAGNDTPAEAEPANPAPVAAAATPLLRVVGDVAGADVFVDRTFVGKTPFETRAITAGSHQIHVSAEGFDGMSRRVEVRADAPTEVTFSLKAVVLDAAVQVVHKHRLGSCDGRLSADLTGLRYAPTRGDDAFHAPLTGLETLAMDYQDKELRVKLKNGKSFSFTTKAANADQLLVFHRDVEKARKRLAGGE